MLDIVQQEQRLGWFFANVLGNDLLPPRRKQSFVDGEVFTDPSSGPG